MTIIIRHKGTGLESDFSEFCELYTDSINIYIVIKYKYGCKKPYSFNKEDYEIAYIG